MSGYNIKSSAFKVAGVMDDVYISDLPNTNKLTGSLFLFSLPSIESQSPTIIRRNVGNIDYKSGVITINPINVQSAMIKDGQSIIEISACPLSNDVIGLQDLYLQLDINNSTFETVVDEISSGLDPSGSNYITSTSYANGNLVRSGGRNTQTTTRTTSVPSTSTTTTTTTGGSSTASTSAASSY